MNKGYRIFITVCRIFVLIFVLVPIIWGLRTSFAASNFDVSIIPKEVTFANYISVVITNRSFVIGLKNSLIVSFGTIIILLPIIILASYALGRMHFKGEKYGKILLFLPLLPGIVMLISLVRMMNTMNLYNRLSGVIILNVIFLIPFTCWLLKNFFESIPVAIEEAAYIDGSSRLGVIILIILPNALPGLAAVMVFIFISSWLSYMYSYAIITDTNLRSITQTLLAYVGQYGIDYNALTASSIMTMIPPLLFFAIFQRWFIKGLFGTSMK